MADLDANSAFAAGKSYVRACTLLFEAAERSEEDRGWTTLPSNLLGAFAVELLLKAALLDAGMTASKVRGINHDLRKLHARVAETVPFNIPELASVVEAFAEDHKAGRYRYPTTGLGMTFANWSRMLPVLQTLCTVMDTRIARSMLLRSLNITPLASLGSLPPDPA